MSIRDLNKTIIITDHYNGEVITTIDKALYDKDCINYMISQLFANDFENEHGLIITYGYKN